LTLIHSLALDEMALDEPIWGECLISLGHPVMCKTTPMFDDGNTTLCRHHTTKKSCPFQAPPPFSATMDTQYSGPQN
jgi:hypothetical protein